MKLRWNKKLIFPLLILAIGGWLLWPNSKPAAEWFNENWQFRKKITVTNNTSAESNKYVTLSSFDTTNDVRFQTDCGDVRFVKSNGEILPYYVVSGCDTSNTTFHINFDSLPAGAQDIYIYYGNPTVANGGVGADFSSAATNATVGTPATEETTPGPISYWKFDEGADNTCAGGTNDACDTISQKNDLALSGATWTTDGSCIAGSCLQFDGTNDFLSRSGGGGGGNAAQFVQECTGSASLVNGDVGIDVACNTTAGNLVVVMVITNTGPTREIDTVNDLGGNTYNRCTTCEWTADGVANAGYYWYSLTTSDSTSVHVESNEAGSNVISPHVSIIEFSGISASPFDVGSGNGVSSSGTSLTSNTTGTTAQANEVAIGHLGVLNTGTITGSGTGWTYNTTYAGTSYRIKSGYKILTATGTETNTGTAGTSGLWTASVGTFKAETAAAGDTELDPGTGSFTIGGWFKHSASISGTDVFVSRADGVNGVGYKLYYDATNGVCFGIDQTAGSFPVDSACTTTSYADNQWHYIAGVKSGTSSLTLYIDGRPVAQDTSITSETITGTASSLYVGVDADGTSNPWHGYIDEVKYYGYARTADQIKTDAVKPPGQAAKGNSAVFGEAGAIGVGITAPVGYWKFNEGALNTCLNGTDDFCDATSNRNDIAFSGTAGGITLSGKFNKAFDGNAARWATRADDADFDFAAADDFTITAWLKTDSTSPSASEYILNKSSAISQGYGIYGTSTGKIVFAIDSDTSWTPSDQAQSTTNVFDQAWHHIAARKTGTSKIDIFVDGRLEGSDATLGANGSLTNSVALYIADRDGTDNGDEFNGDLDDVKIYRAALTDDQIKIDYNRGSSAVFGNSSTASNGTTADNSAAREYCVPGDTTSCTAPVGEWNLDENTGTTSTYDSSGNNKNGTLNSILPISWVVGKKGSALILDGSADYVDIGTGPTSVKTISFWAYPATTTEYFINLTGTSDYIWANAGTVTATGLDTPTIYVDGKATTAITANAWQHISIVTNTAENASNMDIGRTQDANYLEGKIDQVRMYDYARTQAQVAWEYNRGAPIGQYKFDDCSGTTAYNMAANGNNRPIGNNGTWSGSSGGNTSAGTCTTSGAWYNGVQGKRNYSLDFDGTDDVVTVTNASIIDLNEGLLNGFTVSAWVYANSDGEADAGQIFQKGDADTFFRVDSQDGSNNLDLEVGLALGSAGTSDDAAVNVADAFQINTWNHVAISWTNDADDEITVWINGKPRGVSTAGAGDPEADTGNLLIGGATGANFDGKIDDFYIHPYELTESQFKTLYTGGALNFTPITGAP